MRLGPLLLALALSCTLALPRAAAQDVAPGRDGVTPERAAQVPRSAADVVAMLSGFEGAPSAAEWRAIGPAAVPLLRAVVADSAVPGFVRLRAVHALGTFATSEVRSELRRLLRSPEPLVAREAALAMARAFGGGAEADVAPLLAHSDVAVREAAIDALARMGTRGARARLEQRLARERDEALRERIQDRLRGGVWSSPDEGEGNP